MIKVKLLEHTPNPERVVAMAARLCYSPIGAEELSEKLSEAQVKKIFKRLHPSITYRYSTTCI